MHITDFILVPPSVHSANQLSSFLSDKSKTSLKFPIN